MFILLEIYTLLHVEADREANDVGQSDRTFDGKKKTFLFLYFLCVLILVINQKNTKSSRCLLCVCAIAKLFAFVYTVNCNI
jgi:hypothetical protein